MISDAYFIDNTDVDGWVYYEKVPAGSTYYNSYMRYSVLVYYDESNFVFPYR
ncbi:MAG: hypothetical protein U9R19_03195 [Bacteroidota bacterium]|nr:hypothetical protein [Bacteroidota bacterium]